MNSVFWARLLGTFTVIVAGGAFFKIDSFNAWLSELSNNHGLLMVMGVFTLLLGITIVISHNVWRGWPIIVTILGYWIIIKGIALLYFPQLVQNAMVFWQGKNVFWAPLPALGIGLILLYFGFIRK